MENLDINNVLAVDSVNYGIDPLTNWFMDFANSEKEIDEKFADRTVHEIIKVILTSKNVCWDYENEFRIINKNPGRFDIPKECIKQICFGLDASNEDIALIKNIVSNYDHEVGLSKVVKGGTDFGIAYEKIQGVR